MRHEVTVKIHGKFSKKLTRLPCRATTTIIIIIIIIITTSKSVDSTISAGHTVG